jgi:hypothetical protein
MKNEERRIKNEELKRKLLILNSSFFILHFFGLDVPAFLKLAIVTHLGRNGRLERLPHVGFALDKCHYRE